MESVEVIIVGGGPAGSTCAKQLVRNNVECLVLDKATFPRHKLCAGWITPEVVKDLEMDISDYPYRFLSFDHLHFHVPLFGVKTKTIQHSIRRYEFDQWLLEQSAAPFKQHEVRKICQDGAHYIIDDMFRCKYIVGAGGTRCPVYRSLFKEANPRAKELQAVTLEEEFPYNYDDDSCHLWFFDKGLPGYSWYVPKADGYINVGIGAVATKLKMKQDDIKPHWQNLINKLTRKGMIKDYTFSAKGYSYFIRGDVKVGRIKNAFILGDAAGLATRDMCEGIGPAIKSGMMAADTIINGAQYALEPIARYTSDSGLIKKLMEYKLHRN